MELRPEQVQALSYARRQGSEAPIDVIRGKVGATFRELETLLASVPAELTGQRPAESAWSIHEVVDHLVVSHRRAVEELTDLVAGRTPRSGPIPAGLVSDDPFAITWSDLVGELKAIHRRFVAALEGASDETPLTARAPIEMVVKCRQPDGRVEPVHWVESFDWKAYAILFRAHSIEHVHQIRRTLAAVGENTPSTSENVS